MIIKKETKIFLFVSFIYLIYFDFDDDDHLQSNRKSIHHNQFITYFPSIFHFMNNVWRERYVNEKNISPNQKSKEKIDIYLLPLGIYFSSLSFHHQWCLFVTIIYQILCTEQTFRIKSIQERKVFMMMMMIINLFLLRFFFLSYVFGM